jgi:hypothetical protein
MMGLGLRIFLVDDDDALERLSVAKFERLFRHDPQEMLPQYAGRRVRYALAIVELVNRKPVELVHAEYSFLHFDSEGRMDTAEMEKAARLALEALSPIFTNRERPQVVDARHRFAKKRFDDRYKWTPSRDLRSEIFKAIFGKRQPDLF